MKQKLIYLVILMAAMNMPADSRECGKPSCCPLLNINMTAGKSKAVVKIEETDAVAASPFSRLLFNL